MSTFEQFYDQFGGESSGYGLDHGPEMHPAGVGAGFYEEEFIEFGDDDEDDFGYDDDDDEFGAYEDWEIGAAQYVPTASDLTRQGFYEGYGASEFAADEYGMMQFGRKTRAERAAERKARKDARKAARAATAAQRAQTKAARAATPKGQRRAAERTEANNFLSNLFKSGGKNLLTTGVQEGTRAARGGLRSLSSRGRRPKRRRGRKRAPARRPATTRRRTQTVSMPITRTTSAVAPAPTVAKAGMGTGAMVGIAALGIAGFMLLGKKK